MITSSHVKSKLNTVINSYGQIIRLKYYLVSGADSGYDDDVGLAQSGNSVWTSGLIQPIDQKRGSYDSILMEQGKVLQNDSKIYLNGEVNTSGTIKIGIGSPVTREYSILDIGINAHGINGENSYKKIYVRVLTNGSLIGE